MTVFNRDVIIVEDTVANLTANLKNQMKAYNLPEDRFAYKTAAGVMKFVSQDELQMLLATTQTVTGLKTFTANLTANQLITSLKDVRTKGLMMQGRVIAGAGGASSGTAEQVDVTNVGFVTLAPAGGFRFYDFINKVDGQVIFINKLSGTNGVEIDTTIATDVIYMNSADRNAVVRWDATDDTWSGVRGTGIQTP